MTEDATGWAKQFSLYFYPLNAEIAQEWVDQLKREWRVQYLDDRELCLCVRDLAADKDGPRRPMLKDMLHAIRRRRARSETIRQANEAPPTRCELCLGVGMLTYSADLSPETGNVIFETVTVAFDGLVPHGHISIPCTCSRGNQLNVFQKQPERLRRLVSGLYQQRLREVAAQNAAGREA